MSACLIVQPAALAGPGSGKKSSGDEAWVELPAINATAMRQLGLRGILHVNAGMEVADPDLRDRVEGVTPRLRAACSEALRDYTALYHDPGAPPDPAQIRRMLQRAVDETLHAHGAAEVLLLSVLVHEG